VRERAQGIRRSVTANPRGSASFSEQVEVGGPGAPHASGSDFHSLINNVPSFRRYPSILHISGMFTLFKIYE